MRALVVAMLLVAACTPPPRHARPTASDRIAFYDGLNQKRENGTEPSTPVPDAVLQAIHAYESHAEPALEAPLRRWLYERDQDFVEAYLLQTDKVKRSPHGSLWHQAETEWCRWVTTTYPTLTREEVQHLSFVAQGTSPEVDVFPMLDRVEAGKAIAELWLRQPPIKGDTYRDTLGLLYYDRGHLLPSGKGWWYRSALATEDGAKRLAAFVREKHDAKLTEIVAINVAVQQSPHSIDFLRGLEDDAKTWNEAIIAMGRTEARAWQNDDFVPELERAWKAHPDRHGPILWSLAVLSGEVITPATRVEGPVPWIYFAPTFGSGVTKEDLASFLDQYPRALEFMAWLRPAYTHGWSEADVVRPRLEAYRALPADEPKEAPRGPGFHESDRPAESHSKR